MQQHQPDKEAIDEEEIPYLALAKPLISNSVSLKSWLSPRYHCTPFFLQNDIDPRIFNLLYTLTPKILSSKPLKIMPIFSHSRQSLEATI
jgi:hypothetical protein